MGNPFEQASASPAEDEEEDETPEVAAKRREEFQQRQEQARQREEARLKEFANSNETKKGVADGLFALARLDLSRIDDLSTCTTGTWINHVKTSQLEQAKQVLDRIIEAKQAEKKA